MTASIKEALEEIIQIYERSVGRQNEKLADIPMIAQRALAAAESELSTIRARVREVVWPFARMSSVLGFAGATEHDEIELSGEVLHGALEAARQLMEELTSSPPKRGSLQQEDDVPPRL